MLVREQRGETDYYYRRSPQPTPSRKPIRPKECNQWGNVNMSTGKGVIHMIVCINPVQELSGPIWSRQCGAHYIRRNTAKIVSPVTLTSAAAMKNASYRRSSMRHIAQIHAATHHPQINT